MKLAMTVTVKAMDTQRWVCRIHVFQFIFPPVMSHHRRLVRHYHDGPRRRNVTSVVARADQTTAFSSPLSADFGSVEPVIRGICRTGAEPVREGQRRVEESG